MVRTSTPSQKQSQRGSYMLLASILTLVFLGLCGLVFGSAILASSRVRLKNLTNLSALAGLNGYLSESDPAKKAATAAAFVNGILSKNSIPNSRLGQLDSGSTAITAYPDTSGQSGYLRFGLWYPSKPTCVNCADTCAGVYPCFKDAEPGQAVNAVKAVLKTGTSNPIIAPTQFVGGTEFLLQENSIASLVPRCVSFVLDVSTSTAEQTHGGYPKDPPDPTQPPGFLAYRVVDRDLDPDTGVVKIFDYDNDRSETLFESCTYSARKYRTGSDIGLWCANDVDLPIKLDRAQAPNPGPYDHFQDDYWYARTPISDPAGVLGPHKFLIDAYSFTHLHPPEPLTTFLRAFNAGAQKIAEESSSGDAVGVVAFAGSIVSKTGMSSAVDLIRQLTNVRNAFPANYQESSVSHPNFVDWNWFPISSDQGSNVIAALHEAYDQLVDPSVCPSFAKKIIILATDGLVNSVDTAKLPEANCARKLANGETPGPNGNLYRCDADGMDEWYPGHVDTPCMKCDGVNGLSAPRFDIGQDFVHYAVTEKQIMAENPVPVRTWTMDQMGNVNQSYANSESGILKLLSDAGIAVTVLMSGKQTGPNFLNVGGPDGKYVNPEDAGPLGWDGLPYSGGSFSPFVKWTSADNPDASLAEANAEDGPDELAFQTAGPDAPFYRPNGLLSELSFRTGGIFCPLMEPGDEGRYDPADASGVRYMSQSERAADTTHFGMQQSSITYRSITEQARDCVSKSLGANPYALQEEWSPPK